MNEPVRPPRWLRILAEVLVRGPGREFVLGDLEELYARRAAARGKHRAVVRYTVEAVVSAVVALGSGRRHTGKGLLAGSSGGELASDMRLALRSFRHRRGFVVLAVGTLALGVGSSAAVFGMVNQLLLRPLPGVRDGNGAAYLQFRSVSEPERTQGRNISTPDFDELRRGASLLDGVASFGYVSLKMAVGESRPVAVMGTRIYGDYFEVLRAWPAAGRLLASPETGTDADPLHAVISESLAASLFGSAGAAVGGTVRMNDQPVTVIGVAGGGFSGAERGVESDVWLPLSSLGPLVGFPSEGLTDPGAPLHGDIIIRSREGAEPEAVRAHVGSLLERLGDGESENAADLAELRPMVFPGLNTPPLVRAATYRTLRTLAVVVGLVLLIACANVANLLLFRNVQRRGAVATLRALGASTPRIARQQIIESLILGFMGTVAGLAVGWLIALPFRGAELMRMPAFEGLVPDGRVALFAGAACVLTTLLFGAVPALVAGRFDLAQSLRSASGRDTGRTGHLRAALSAGQLALGLALVVGALLLVRSMDNLYSADLGFDTDGIAELHVDHARGLEAAEQEALQRTLLASVQHVPGVEGVAASPYSPYGPSFVGRLRLPDTPAEGDLRPNMVAVTPGWFELLDVSVVRGRAFRAEDWGSSAPNRVIITASVAEKLFGRTDVVGRTVEAGFTDTEPMEVIGVVEDLRSAFAPDKTEDAFFVTPANAPGSITYFTLLIRTPGFDAPTARAIRTAVEAVLPDEPVSDPVLASDRFVSINSEAQVYGRLLSLLAVVAVALAAVGLYGVLAFSVAARRREFGVRLALGASRTRIAHLVARSATITVATGTGLGLFAAYLLSRLLENRLFGVEPLDAASYAAAVVLFTAVGAVAAWLPARRAVTVDPVTALREE